ncbi:hypothetical protein AWH61_17480 [Alteromonas sp. W12]|nr:hypothetical protein AWH61_17480 [Alteromonas sp. W12]
MAFTIDIEKNREISELSFLPAEGVYSQKPKSNEKHPSALPEDFRESLPPVGLIKPNNNYLFGKGCLLTELRKRIQLLFSPCLSQCRGSRSALRVFKF